MRRSINWDEADKKILEALTAGNTRQASYTYAGVSQDAFNRRFNANAAFREAVEAAEASAEVRNVAMISKAANKSWQASAWWLERRRSGDWAKKDVLTIRRELEDKSDDELYEIIGAGLHSQEDGGGDISGPDPSTQEGTS